MQKQKGNNKHRWASVDVLWTNILRSKRNLHDTRTFCIGDSLNKCIGTPVVHVWSEEEGSFEEDEYPPETEYG